MAGLLKIEVMTPNQTGTELANVRPPASGVMAGLEWLSAVFAEAGRMGARARVAVDESNAVTASGTVTLTQASLTVGDFVGIGSYALTAVTGTADPTAGTWSKDTSDTAAATSLAAAINGYPPVKALVSATSAVGVVTIVSRLSGTVGNTIALTEKDAGGGIARSGNNLAGGIDPGTLQSVLVTFTGQPAINDTITIGGAAITFVAASGNEDQVTIGGSTAATVTNAIAIINANSKFRGIVVASQGAGTTMLLTLQQSGRIGRLITLAKSAANISALPAASFVQSTSEAWRANAVIYQVGSPP